MYDVFYLDNAIDLLPAVVVQVAIKVTTGGRHVVGLPLEGDSKVNHLCLFSFLPQILGCRYVTLSIHISPALLS